MNAKDRLLDLADRIGRAGINGFGNEVRDIAESLSADRGEAAGVAMAAAYIQKKADDYALEHCSS